jgi:hypothetical protein
MIKITPFLLAGVLSFVVYLLTLAPTITWRNDGLDSGDLAAAVAVGGVPHPPGYPTYLILGDLFAGLPYGDVAYRLNLLSAVCAALAVSLTALTLAQSLPTHPSAWLSSFCAISTALVLAFSPLFWSQAIIAEVYALNTLFVGLLLYGTLRTRSTGESWPIPLLFGVLGLGLGNHPSLLLVTPLLFFGLGLRRLRQVALASSLALGAGLSIYLIIPIRAAAWPPINWGGAVTWPNFFWLATTQLYHHFLFALPADFILTRLFNLILLLAKSFLWVGLLLGLLGLRRLFTEDRVLAQGSLVTFGAVSVYAVSYNTSDSYVYLLPALMLFVVWLGWGLYELLYPLSGSQPVANSLIIAGLIVLPFLALSFNFSAQNLSQEREAYHYTRQSLQQVAPEAVIIADDEARTFALWYGRYGLNLRPDVAIVNSHLLAYEWYRQTLHQTHPQLLLTDERGQPLTTLPRLIEANLAHLPLYLAMTQPPALAGYYLEPSGPLQRVRKLDQ